MGSAVGVWSVVGFGAVAHREGGAGVGGVGVGEGCADFVNGWGVSWCGLWVEPDVQGAWKACRHRRHRRRTLQSGTRV
jgi:hypothetical protein